MIAPTFQGGRRLIAIAGAVGAAGLGLTALGGLADPRQALASYLVAFVYWVGIALERRCGHRSSPWSCFMVSAGTCAAVACCESCSART